MEKINGDFLEEPKKSINVSWSQYQTWWACPYHWKLSYLDGNYIFDSSLNSVFGDAIHECLQTYIDILYNKSATEADSVDLFEFFKEFLLKELKQEKFKSLVYTKDTLFEFVQNGKDILDWFVLPENRIKLFPSKIYEILGIELELLLPVRKNINYKGYLDLVLRNKIDKTIRIVDFKTSSFGWNKYVKADEMKTHQLLLYKKFLSDKLQVPLDKIDVEYIILKRNLLEGYSQNRCEKFIPTNGKVSVIQAHKKFEDFLNSCFTSHGLHNKSGHFPKTPHKGKTKYKNCKYCPFYNKPEFCDSVEDKNNE